MARRRASSPQSADSYVRGVVGRSPNLLVPHFLIHSYLYYVCDWPIITDETFDYIVEELDAKWETVQHRHKALLDRELLKTGFYLKYPRIAVSAATALVRQFKPRGAPIRRRIDETHILQGDALRRALEPDPGAGPIVAT